MNLVFIEDFIAEQSTDLYVTKNICKSSQMCYQQVDRKFMNGA